MNKKFAIVVILAVLLQFPAYAQEIEDETNIEIYGFLMGNYSWRTSGQKPEGEEGDHELIWCGRPAVAAGCPRGTAR